MQVIQSTKLANVCYEIRGPVLEEAMRLHHSASHKQARIRAREMLEGNPDVRDVVPVAARPSFVEHRALVRRLWRRYDLAVESLHAEALALRITAVLYAAFAFFMCHERKFENLKI